MDNAHVTDVSPEYVNLAADPAPPPEYVSEQDYWAHYYECEQNYEWNNGHLEAKPVSDWQTWFVYQWFFTLLQAYLNTYPIAKTTGLEFGFRLPLVHKTVIRKPDLGVILHDNRVKMDLLDRSFKGVYDLCIEALSDSTAQEALRDMQTKKLEYQEGGVREYYILHPKAKYQAFYYLDENGIYQSLPMAKGIICSRVLPGFQFRIADLNRQPSADEMLQDDIYRDFFNPQWLADKHARDEAEQRANAEAQRANAEAQRANAAEAELARLRAIYQGG